MNPFFYNIGISVYGILIGVAALFNKKAKLFVLGRRNIFQKMESKYVHDGKPLAWFHCASLGEFEQGRPLIENFKKVYPGYKILLTFFSPSGYEIRKKYEMADYIFYLPLDSPKNSKKFLAIFRPSISFFIKYEFWYNYINQLHINHTPTFSISSIFRPEQVFFRRWGQFYLNILEKFDRIFVQNQTSWQLLRNYNIHQSELVGDTRFDRVRDICQNVSDLKVVENFKGKSHLMVIGSSWEEDMLILIPFINKHTRLKFIIAPHEIDEDAIKNLENEIKGKTIRYSNANQIDPSVQVLIIDNVGMLSSLYQYGEYAYIGGAFGKGLHNILEAVTFGLPVFFGNKRYKKFQEANDLIALGGAFTVGSDGDLNSYYDQLSNNADKLSKCNEINKQYVEDNTGATEKIINYLKTNWENEGKGI